MQRYYIGTNCNFNVEDDVITIVIKHALRMCSNHNDINMWLIDDYVDGKWIRNATCINGVIDIIKDNCMMHADEAVELLQKNIDIIREKQTTVGRHGQSNAMSLEQEIANSMSLVPSVNCEKEKTIVQKN